MSTRALNLDTLSPATTAMFHFLADKTWATNDEIITAGANACITQEADKALKNGERVRRKALAAGTVISRDDLMASGARDIARNCLMIAVRTGRLERRGDTHRMLPATRSEWGRLTNPAPAPATPAPTTTVAPITVTKSNAKAPKATAKASASATVTPIGEAPSKKRKGSNAPLIFNGVEENVGFDAAPLLTYDRVHFGTENRMIDLAEFRAQFTDDCVIGYDDSEGLYRVDVPSGGGATQRDFIREWCADNGIILRGLRADANVRRRDIHLLDRDFLNDLTSHYIDFALTVLRKKMTVLKFHISDADDLRQQVSEWVLAAVAMFDHTMGVPFGAFLHQRLSVWVHDLNRKTYGRTATDAELKQQRAYAKFNHEHGRPPTEAEMAASMGQTIDQYRRNAKTVSQLQSMRNMQTLDAPEGDFEIQIPTASATDESVLDEEQTAFMSAMLTAACGADPDAKGVRMDRPNMIGWLTWYGHFWKGQTKTELSELLGTSMRNLNVHADKAMDKMRDRRDEVFA